MALTRRILDDIFRRKAGFRVILRPRTGQATWEREGFLYTDAEALNLARRHKPPAAGNAAAAVTEGK